MPNFYDNFLVRIKISVSSIHIPKRKFKLFKNFKLYFIFKALLYKKYLFRKFFGKIKIFCLVKYFRGPSLHYVGKRTGWVRSEKWQYLLTFSTIYADVGWVGQKKFKNLLT